MKYVVCFLTLIACFALVSCGQYGGLYLPKHHHNVKEGVTIDGEIS